MYFLLTTLGCKVNQYESGVISAEMKKHGFSLAPDAESADIFILNSCTVTENSDRKARRLINSAKSKKPGIITVLTGCFPQAFPDAARVLGADIICGTGERKTLPLLIDVFIREHREVERIKPCPDVYEDFTEFNTNSDKTRAFIKIQDGCDNNCAYCVIPRARGKPRSRPLESVRAEALAAVDSGHKEIVLTGINLTKYFDLCGAVNAVSEYAERVRLSSVEPDLLGDSLLERLSLEKKLCPHFHMSLQSGSDGVLKRMGRRYTAREYYERVLKIRSLFKGSNEISFTTDIIVGFPGETDEEFNESLEFVQKTNFSKIHVFPFSARPGTPAASMLNQVPDCVKNERRGKMLKAADELRRCFLAAQAGGVLSVLVEKRTSPGEVFGHARNYAPVKILSENAMRNEILNVKIIEAGNGVCIGCT